MSATLYDLIGQTIQAPAPRAAAQPRAAALPNEPLSALIGRMISAPAPALVATPLPAARPAAEVPLAPAV